MSGKDFETHKGGSLLLMYNSSPAAAVMAYLPDYPWKEWLFSGVPHGFWDKPNNRRRYMAWLGEQVGIKKPEDWYAVTRAQFFAHAGFQFIKLYNGSPIAALQDYLPKYPWKEWLFYRVPS